MPGSLFENPNTFSLHVLKHFLNLQKERLWNPMLCKNIVRAGILTIAIVSCHPATTLTSWHLIVTFCSLHVAQWIHLFENKPFDSRTVIMGFGVLNGISIGLLNLCLGFNSVGFYQVTVCTFSFE
jgi:hypothetical protein